MSADMLEGIVPLPKTVAPITPPTDAPITLIKIATGSPPAAGPGIAILATEPSTSPITIHDAINIVSLFLAGNCHCREATADQSIQPFVPQ
jgi:hypothetical protein